MTNQLTVCYFDIPCVFVICLLAPSSDYFGIGWRFATSDETLNGANTIPDPVNGVQNIRDLYLLARPNYSGRFSVPVLWDKKTNPIVSKESSEIIRMFSTEFDGLLDEEHRAVIIIPEELTQTVDVLNGWIYVRSVLQNTPS